MLTFLLIQSLNFFLLLIDESLDIIKVLANDCLIVVSCNLTVLLDISYHFDKVAFSLVSIELNHSSSEELILMVYSVGFVPVVLLLISWIATFEICEKHPEEVIVPKELYFGIDAEPIPFNVLFSKLLLDPITNK